VQRGTVVGGMSGRKPVVDERSVDRSAPLLAVVVWAEAAGQDSEAVSERTERAPERVRDAALEPAVRARAHAAEDGAAQTPGCSRREAGSLVRARR